MPQRRIQPGKRSLRFHGPRRGYRLSSETPAARTAPRGRSLSASAALQKPPGKQGDRDRSEKAQETARGQPSREVAGSRVPEDVKRPGEAAIRTRAQEGLSVEEHEGTEAKRRQQRSCWRKENSVPACLPSKRRPGTPAVSKEASRMRQERYDGGHCLCPSPAGEPRLPARPGRSDGRRAEHRLGAGAAEPAARVHVSSAVPVARPLGAGRNSASPCPARQGVGEGNTPCSAETRGRAGLRSNSAWRCQAAR